MRTYERSVGWLAGWIYCMCFLLLLPRYVRTLFDFVCVCLSKYTPPLLLHCYSACNFYLFIIIIIIVHIVVGYFFSLFFFVLIVIICIVVSLFLPIGFESYTLCVDIHSNRILCNHFILVAYRCEMKSIKRKKPGRKREMIVSKRCGRVKETALLLKVKATTNYSHWNCSQYVISFHVHFFLSSSIRQNFRNGNKQRMKPFSIEDSLADWRCHFQECFFRYHIKLKQKANMAGLQKHRLIYQYVCAINWIMKNNFNLAFVHIKSSYVECVQLVGINERFEHSKNYWKET